MIFDHAVKVWSNPARLEIIRLGNWARRARYTAMRVVCKMRWRMPTTGDGVYCLNMLRRAGFVKLHKDGGAACVMVWRFRP